MYGDKSVLALLDSKRTDNGLWRDVVPLKKSQASATINKRKDLQDAVLCHGMQWKWLTVTVSWDKLDSRPSCLNPTSNSVCWMRFMAPIQLLKMFTRLCTFCVDGVILRGQL